MEEKFVANEVWLVVANYETQLQRLMTRDNIDITYAKSKIESQDQLLTMKENSNVIFDNSTSIENLRKELEIVLKQKDLL